MSEIKDILSKYSGRSDLIDALEEIQALRGYVSMADMKAIEEEMEIPLVEIHGVVTFYSEFKLKPAGRHTLRICKGTACHVKGADSIQEAIEEALKITSGEVTEDGRFSIQEVNCIGACAKAPAVMIDDTVHGELTVEKIRKIISEYK